MNGFQKNRRKLHLYDRNNKQKRVEKCVFRRYFWLILNMTVYSGFSYLQRNRFAVRQLDFPPSDHLGIVVVIPCYDEPDLLRTFHSLESCKAPQMDVEIIVVINSASSSSAQVRIQNEITHKQAVSWANSAKRNFPFHFLFFPDLPPKHAGVGLARKIGMDEAIDRLEQAGNPNGVIVCLDADATVADNYFTEIEQIFSRYPTTEAISIYFEHPLEGTEFPPEIYRGIIHYELFLRYYNQALRFAGYPYAFHAVGSSMAVSAKAYQLQGGMNRRKAGEDFYFLHKFLPENRVRELLSTTVFPSPRPSDKVPFGTGKAIRKWLEEGAEEWKTYAPQIFIDLQSFISAIPAYYESLPDDLPESVREFLLVEKFYEKLTEIRTHVTHQKAFIKRFYHWFDGLKVLKFVHFLRDHYYPDVPVAFAAATLYQKLTGDWVEGNAKDILYLYRQRERKGITPN